jgi:hypothetical protein
MGANAQTTVPTFVASQVLTADQQNQSARTGVPVFATTVERDAAFGGTGEKVLAEGQLAYLESTNVVQYYDGAAWATVGPITSGVVQVKSTAKTDTFSFTTNSFVDVTGLSVSITPTSASNKVFVVVSISIGSSVTSSALFKILRDSTDIAVGDTAGSRTRTTGSTFSADGNVAYSVGATFLDSPATTSATTYKIQIRNANAANTGYVNRSVTDTDTNGTVRTVSTVTVFEVAP